jgi:hypothetical protein
VLARAKNGITSSYFRDLVETSPDVPSNSWLSATFDIPIVNRGRLSDKRYSSFVH